MQRAPYILTGTALGLVGVLSIHAASPGTSHALTSSHASSTTTATTTTTSAATTSASRTAAKTSASTVRSATGEDVQFQYGDLEVKVTMSGSKITDISIAQLNYDDPRSQQIDEQAIPMLRAEALSAQSANIDTVSGASYTSAAYTQSLQAALDKLKSA
jgi:uncharacterized protein with FMN-binding domain